jgi:hypothetical protein
VSSVVGKCVILCLSVVDEPYGIMWCEDCLNSQSLTNLLYYND